MLRDAPLIITQVHISKPSSALQSALKMLLLRLLGSSPLSVSLLIIPTFIPLSLSPSHSNTTRIRYLLSRSTHLPSHVNKNKIPELSLPLSSSSSSLSFHHSFLLSICSADERRLWSLSAGV